MKTAFVLAIGLCALGLTSADNLLKELEKDLENYFEKQPSNHGDSSVYGDPQVKGLDGRTFLFDGVAGEVFNFISEQDHQLNALFVEGPHDIAVLGKEGVHNGTFISSLGLKMHNTTVQVETDEKGAMSVAVNGEPVTLTGADNYRQAFSFADNVSVTVDKFRETYGEAVQARSQLYDLIIYSTPCGWDSEVNQTVRGHLNMAMSVDRTLYFQSDVHGVLGQITPNSATDNGLLPPEMQTAFLGEGTDMDYQVSGLFADDFRFNRFNVTSSKLTAGTTKAQSTNSQPKASRRRLQEGIIGIDSTWTSMGTVAGTH